MPDSCLTSPQTGHCPSDESASIASSSGSGCGAPGGGGGGGVVAAVVVVVVAELAVAAAAAAVRWYDAAGVVAESLRVASHSLCLCGSVSAEINDHEGL